MTLISGLSVALMTPKIRATTSSVPTFDQPLPASSSIPGTTAVATPRAAAETTTRSRNFINQILLDLGVTYSSVANFPGRRPGRPTRWIPAEETPVGDGSGAAPGAEVVPQGGRVAEAGVVGDRVHRLVALLEQLLGQQDALPDQPQLRRGSRVLHEAPGKGPLGHVRAGRQLAHGEGLVEVAAQPFQQVPQRAIA